jgi:hypothetical protein
MIIDSFLYYNEADVADIRINELKDVVDKFIVLSGETTWRGNPNPHEFPAHLHEIADISVYKFPFPAGKLFWDAERWMRNYMQRLVRRFGANDRVIFSDADEIARASVIQNLEAGRYALELDQYYYHFENYIRHHDCMFIAPISHLKAMYEMRFEWNRSSPGTPQPNPRDQRRLARHFPTIEGAGWEFSFFGDVEFIQNKIGNYSHAEINIPEYADAENIERRMRGDIDIIDRPKEGAPKGPLPQYVLDNKEKFARFWRNDGDTPNLVGKSDAATIH